MDLLLNPGDLFPANSCLVLMIGGHPPRTAVQKVGQGEESSTIVGQKEGLLQHPSYSYINTTQPQQLIKRKLNYLTTGQMNLMKLKLKEYLKFLTSPDRPPRPSSPPL